MARFPVKGEWRSKMTAFSKFVAQLRRRSRVTAATALFITGWALGGCGGLGLGGSTSERTGGAFGDSGSPDQLLEADLARLGAERGLSLEIAAPQADGASRVLSLDVAAVLASSEDGQEASGAMARVIPTATLDGNPIGVRLIPGSDPAAQEVLSGSPEWNPAEADEHALLVVDLTEDMPFAAALAPDPTDSPLMYAEVACVGPLCRVSDAAPGTGSGGAGPGGGTAKMTVREATSNKDPTASGIAWDLAGEAWDAGASFARDLWSDEENTCKRTGLRIGATALGLFALSRLGGGGSAQVVMQVGGQYVFRKASRFAVVAGLRKLGGWSFRIGNNGIPFILRKLGLDRAVGVVAGDARGYLGIATFALTSVGMSAVLESAYDNAIKDGGLCVEYLKGVDRAGGRLITGQ